MKQIDINVVNLKLLADNGRIKEFASFIYLKSLYSNSCIFNYTQKSLAEKSGMSLGAIKKCVKSFLNSGWCRMHKGNLVFNKLKTFDHNKKKVIRQVTVSSVKQILQDLYKLILTNLQDRFNRIKSIAADLHNSHPKIRRKAERKAEKMNLDTKKLPGVGELLTISMKRISKLFGCSVGTASGIIKQFKKEKKIRCFIERSSIPMNKRAAKSEMNHYPNSFYHNGYLITVQCNKYDFNI